MQRRDTSQTKHLSWSARAGTELTESDLKLHTDTQLIGR